MIETKDLTCGYKNKTLLSKINLSLEEGEILSILGPNGVGKTTFYKTVLGFVPAQLGFVTYNKKRLTELSVKSLAKIIAYVPQASKIMFNFSVSDVMLMGRYAYMEKFTMPTESDERLVEDVLNTLGIEHLRCNKFNQISGGEQQMVLIARAMVQGAKYFIMDEPTANLDFGNQLKVLQVIEDLSQLGKGIMMTTHEPNHALHHSTKTAVFYDSSMYQYGNPRTVLTEDLIREIYHLDQKIDIKNKFNLGSA